MSDTRNAHQRKLAVMKRCAGIKPDKKHPAHHYDYVSIQNLSNLLRDYCVEEGLDPNAGFDRESGMYALDLVNADNPSDHIVTYWPVIEGDKGWAFTTKFPLIRTFLVGDGEEADESEMAERSARTATRAAQRSNGNGHPPAIDGTTPEQMEMLYALTDKLGQSHLEVDALVRRHGYTRILERATASIAEKEAAEQPALPAVAAALDVPPAGSES